ncbi:MAG: hypothetical protein WCK67_10745 [bacterium]
MKEECKGYHGEQEEKYECSCSEKFQMIAKEAWKELLKDKIKAEIERTKGPHIEKLAELVTKASSEQWEHKMSAMMKHEEYKENLKDFFLCKDK